MLANYLLTAALVVILSLVAAVGDAADTLVICPPAFRPALSPWLEHRSAQGHSIRVIDTNPSAGLLRERIKAADAGGKLRTVLLIGDCRPPAAVEPTSPAAGRIVPTHYVRARAIQKFGPEQQIATDNGFADLDGDHVPDVTVARLPVESADELKDLVARIINYETRADFGTWRRRVNVIAGVGGFGALLDAVIENTTKMLLVGGIPAGYESTMTHASWTSPYCPDPRALAATAMGRLNEGCLFWVYVGHGHPYELDWMRAGDARYPILTTAHLPQITCRKTPPIALFFSCYAGAIDAPEDCLAERLVRHPGGPVATVAGSRVTTPYAMAALGTALMSECFAARRETLGDAFLAAKRSMSNDDRPSCQRQALDALARLLGRKATDLADERHDHLHSFHLLGDPLLRIHHPQPIEVDAPAVVEAGTTIPVAIRSRLGGETTVELVVRRDRLTFSPPRRAVFDDRPAQLAEYQKVYRRANDPGLDEIRQWSTDGRLEVLLQVPPEARGPCHVRVFVRGTGDYAIGSADVSVRSPPAEKSIPEGPDEAGAASNGPEAADGS